MHYLLERLLDVYGRGDRVHHHPPPTTLAKGTGVPHAPRHRAPKNVASAGPEKGEKEAKHQKQSANSATKTCSKTKPKFCHKKDPHTHTTITTHSARSWCFENAGR